MTFPTSSAVTALIYELMRDHVPPDTIEKIVAQDKDRGPYVLTDEALAKRANRVSRDLLEKGGVKPLMHIPWPSIEQFHNVRRTFKALGPEGDHKVAYRAKVKLHGTNAAVHVTPEGTLLCQSRERLITPEDDNCGFARWVHAHRDKWLDALRPGGIAYGEWAGPGVMKGVALNQIPEKVFAVFAVLYDGDLVTEPQAIGDILTGTPAHILPWHGDLDVTVDWDASPEDLAPVLDRINAAVHAVEKCDPWVKSVFGVEGTGEGLVFYPKGPYPWGDSFALRVFKAKGEEHKTVAQKAPAQADPEAAKGLQDFAALVLPPARLEQGAEAVKPDGAETAYDMKRIGAFLGWVSKDVAKECGPELAASGLDPKAASKAVTEYARKWYIAKIAAE